MSRGQITVILLVVLCGAVIYAWVATPRQRSIAAGQTGLQQTPQLAPKKQPTDVSRVADLAISGGENHHYQAPKKNPFGPLYLPVKPVKQSPVPPPVVTRPIEPPRQIVPVVISPQPPAPEPIQPLDVLGYLNKAGDYTVFLASKQGRVFLVKAGDVFADDLIVRSISNKEVTVGRRQTDQQVILRLSEAKSQRLPNAKFQSNRPAFVMPKEPETAKPEAATDKSEPATDRAEPATDKYEPAIYKSDPDDAPETENNQGDQ
ncbi:MAG: hypothetical protein JXQ81_11380 [Desulfuromonadales bacterium]|nr:hypothetical protein [Desulfuromonadales bacterium]